MLKCKPLRQVRAIHMFRFPRLCESALVRLYVQLSSNVMTEELVFLSRDGVADKKRGRVDTAYCASVTATGG